MTLDAQLTDHRAMYAADLHIDRLVARQPPTTLDVNTGHLEEEPAAAVGMTVSGRLLKYVSHPEGFGSDFPWSKALWRLKYHCRKEHEFHRAADRPYWRGSLCHQLVTFTVCRNWSVQNAAEILRYDNPEPVLRYALSYIEATIDEARRKAEKRLRDDEGRGPGAVPAPEWRHHAVPGLHMADCPRCRKESAA